MRRRLVRAAPVAVLAVACGGGGADGAWAATTVDATAGSTVEVVGTTPMPGPGTALRDVPANVQAFDRAELSRQRPTNVAEFLDGNAAGVSVSNAQGNPYQADLYFRGFAASPLIGAPQGLSVFFDGVRINETFGDIVNWDLLPPSAIASIQLIPGSNPVFGFNALGGALAVYTKSGRTDPGTSLEASGGSFARRTVTAEYGGARGAWDWYGTLNLSRDDGWAEHNPSQVQQVYARVGYEVAGTSLSASFTGADNRLEGTQTLPLSFFDEPRQAYTYPDINENRLAMLVLRGRHALTPELDLGASLYWRRYRNRNLSSNVNADYGAVDPASGVVDTTEAFNAQSAIDQTSRGLSIELSSAKPLFARRNRWVVGVNGEYGEADFTRADQAAQFTPTRGAVGIGDFEPDTDAATRVRALGLYFQDTLALTPQWSLSASGRFNHAQVDIEDRSGTAPELDGSHSYSRFNPALGLTFSPSALGTAWAGYSEGNRVPTAMELTCADPQAPCSLPNSFVADPPLKQIVARTIEFGARGRNAALSWSASAFRTELQDDIQFVSSGGAINTGYFRNVGRTRRQGFELMTGWKRSPVALSGRYAYVDARYVDGFVENSPANSTADAGGDIVVGSGDRIPNVPRQSLRLRLDLEPTERGSLGIALLAVGSSFSRGDENNLDASGPVPGYAIVNLDGRYWLARGVQAFFRVDNLADRRYQTFGVLGRNVFTGPDRSFNPAGAIYEPFRGIGAPRGAWVGLRCEWD
jgi:iron complex outermembrane recepter protein